MDLKKTSVDRPMICYFSLTGKVETFVKKTGMRAIKITPALRMRHPFILITSTVGMGQVPEEVTDFLVHNHAYMVAVAASGNRNWDRFSPGMFARAGDIISKQYDVPLLHKFELQGLASDVDKFLEEVNKLEP